MILVIQIIMIGACILEQFATQWTHWLGARLMDVSVASRLNLMRSEKLGSDAPVLY
jgi:hypothetical protein